MAIRDVRVAMAIIGVALACCACGAVGVVGSPSGAYVALDSSRTRANELGAALTHPTEQESTALAGGIQFVAYVPDHAGVYGIRVVFLDSVRESQREAFASRAEEVGADVVWLFDDDLWPDCAPASGCPTVGDTID